MKFLKKFSYKYVVIHDAARPFVSRQLIDKLYSKLQKVKTAVIPVIKAQDTIKVCKNNKVIKDINRENIYMSQTPQFFDYKSLFKVYLKFS